MARKKVSLRKLFTSIIRALLNKADRATTLDGYGITDAYTQEETNQLIEDAGATIWTSSLPPTTPNYTFAISGLEGGTQPKVGDMIIRDAYIYVISSVSDETVFALSRMSIQGKRGATWYAGTAITGTSTTPTAFPNSLIEQSDEGDHYLNTSNQNVYICTTGGDAATALWKYEQNIKGAKGNDGEKAYLHVKYSDDGGATFTANYGEDAGKWIGTYSDDNETDSMRVSDYTWVKIRGDEVTTTKTGSTTKILVNGTESAQVYDGTIIHLAWADSADGTDGFSTSVSSGKKYLGSYADSSQVGSQNPSDYNWSLIKGEDAVLVYIHSSEGTAFKNDQVSTTLTVTIYYGDNTITNQQQLVSAFGAGTYLQWKVRLYGQSTYSTIPSSDPRLSDNGFTFDISPSDVNIQAVFNVQVITTD